MPLRRNNSCHANDLRRNLETRGQTEVSIMAPLNPMKLVGPEKRPGAPDNNASARLKAYSRLGIALAVVWFVANRPFCRHLLMTLWALVFATLLLPKEMMFFVRHPVLLFALPFAAGFVAANLGKSSIATAAAGVVLVVLAIAIYRIVDADPLTSAWLWPRIEASVSHSGIPGVSNASH